VTLRARWETLRARCGMLRARWETLRAGWVTLSQLGYGSRWAQGASGALVALHASALMPYQPVRPPAEGADTGEILSLYRFFATELGYSGVRARRVRISGPLYKHTLFVNYMVCF
jgi:hypothetical protein